MTNCILCGSQDIEGSSEKNPIQIKVECPVCGRYVITDYVKGFDLLEKEKDRKHLLTALVRQASDAGHPLIITTENFTQILDSAPVFESPLENINLALLLIMKRQTKANEFVVFDLGKDFPLVYVHDAGELFYIYRTLLDQKLIENAIGPGQPPRVRLTPEGWKQALEIQKTQRKSKQAFVAMSFAPDLNEAWQNGIKKALEDTGFNAYRVDMDEHNDKIDDRIIAGIRKSGILVADFTYQRQGVYFEAGYAMGLGIPVIRTCKETDIGSVHFDTRQYSHVLWNDPAELRSKLSLRISATIL